jgi:hypothetical protein
MPWFGADVVPTISKPVIDTSAPLRSPETVTALPAAGCSTTAPTATSDRPLVMDRFSL